MFKYLFMLVIALLCNVALADWTRVGRTLETTVSVDKETIRRNGQLVKMWVLTNFTTPQTIDGKEHQSAKTQFEYDCKEERSRVLAIFLYALPGGTGMVTGSESGAEPWYPIPPKSIAVNLWKIACS